MALTPLTVTRRNVVALHFEGATLIPSTSGSAAYSNPITSPHPPIVAVGGDSGNVDYGPPDYLDRYSFLHINSNGEEFGAYYHIDMRASGTGGVNGVLSRDESTWTLTSFFPTPGPVGCYFKDMPADMGAYALNEGRYPEDGSITLGSGNFFAGNANIYPVYNIDGTDETPGIMSMRPALGLYHLWDRDGNSYNAFESEDGFEQTGPGQFYTLSDGDFNYTFLDREPSALSGNTLYMSKWTAEATTDPFAYTNYSIELDDAADDAVFQAIADYDFADLKHIRANYEVFWLATRDMAEEPFLTMTVFVFAKDFTWYDRLDITADGSLNFGTYWQDIEGNHFLVGTHQSAGCEAFQILAASEGGGGGEVDEDITLRVWGFSLDDHDFAVFRLGAAETLVFDLTTKQWAEWSSPLLDHWRAHCGQNWTGIGADTVGLGFGTDVVCGDDTEGVLYILDPTAGRDDDPVTGDPASFTRKVTGGFSLRGRSSAPCNAVQLNASLGSPSQTGAQFTLRTSDNVGQTWLNHGSVTVPAASYDQIVEWRSLGLMRQPGRLFSFEDDGAAVRVGGADLR